MRIAAAVSAALRVFCASCCVVYGAPAVCAACGVAAGGADMVVLAVVVALEGARCQPLDGVGTRLLLVRSRSAAPRCTLHRNLLG